MRTVRCPHCEKRLTVSIENYITIGAPAERTEYGKKPIIGRVTSCLNRAGIQGRTIRELQHSIRGVTAKQLSEILCELMEGKIVVDEVRGKTTYYTMNYGAKNG